MRKYLPLFLLAGVLGLALASPAPAQVGSNCVAWTGNGCIYGTVNGPCPGWFNCVPDGPFLVVCQTMTSQCPPAAAPQEVKKKCPSCGQPISLATGNTYIEETDIRVPGLSGGMTLLRTWNSMWPSTQIASQVGLFGPNWRSNFEERLFWGDDHYLKYARGDGSFWSFGSSGAGWSVAAPANAAVTLVQNSTNWVMTFPNGEKRFFDNTGGALVAIVDRNGNTTQLSYDATTRLVMVTDPSLRHLYFGYANDTSRLVTSVTSDFGISLSYAYDNQGRLVQVTKPDQSTLSFTYDANSMITAVKDSVGKILESHTYDSAGRGLTSSRASGVDSVTLSYQ